MGQKIRWISFWVTLTYWLGSAWGCANNADYDPTPTTLEAPAHEEQAAQDGPSEDDASFAEAASESPEPQETDQTAATPPPTPETPQPEEENRKPQEAAQPPRQQPEGVRAATAKPVSETTRSVRSLDRSKWPRVIIGPADGTTPHGLILFEDLPLETETDQDDEPHYADLDLEVVKLPAEDFSRVNKNASVGQSQLIEALGNAEAQNWNAQNSKHLLLQPIKVSLDLVAVPFHSINESDNQETDVDSPSALQQFLDDLFNKEPREIHEDDSQDTLDDASSDSDSPQEEDATPKGQPVTPANDAPDDTAPDAVTQDEPPTAGK